MPVSRGRKGKKRSGRGRSPARRREVSAAEIVLQSLGDPSQTTCVLDADVLVSELLGIAYVAGGESGAHDAVEAVDDFAEELLELAETSEEPGALELLAALASVGPDGIAEAAAAAFEIRRTAQPDRPVAPWVGDYASLVCTGAYRSTDTYGDLTQYVATFGHGPGNPDLPSHLVLWLLDANSNGGADDIIVVDDADQAMRRLHQLIDDGDGEMSALAEVDAAELRAAVSLGMDLETMTDGAPEEESYCTLRSLAYGRLRLLPATDEADAAEELVSPEERDAVVEAFRRSPEAADLRAEPAASAEPLDDDALRMLAGLAVDFAADYAGGDPLRISPASATMFLLDWVPRQVILDAEDTAALPVVLTAWATYSCRVRERGTPAPIHLAIAEVTDDYLELMASGELRSLSTQILAGLVADGVDITDPEQLSAGLERYNAGLDPR